MKLRKIMKPISLTLVLILCAAFALAGSAFASEEPSASQEASGELIDTEELFTKRDLEQTADLNQAIICNLTSGNAVHITTEGVYVLKGTVTDVTVYVEADKEDKVQLVLDGVSITNSDFPAIYVTKADKVFVTTSADSTLAVTGKFRSDGTTSTDGVIFCRSDLVLNGTAKLTIESTDNGVVCKDDLKITGGTYSITTKDAALEANDSILIKDGTMELNAGTDCLHSDNGDDDTKGYIYIGGGDITLNAEDDAIHALSFLVVDDGNVVINAPEGIEATYVQINGGTLTINSADDGINGAQKSDAYRATIEVNGGEITIVMGSGDTDGIDCNGDIIVRGGTINVTGGSTFDYDGTATYTGGTIIVNGQQLDSIPSPTNTSASN